VADESYLPFVWKPSGYELRVERGEPPKVGAVIENGDGKLRVTKVARSPLPNDPRPCVYLQAV